MIEIAMGHRVTHVARGSSARSSLEHKDRFIPGFVTRHRVKSPARLGTYIFQQWSIANLPPVVHKDRIPHREVSLFCLCALFCGHRFSVAWRRDEACHFAVTPFSEKINQRTATRFQKIFQPVSTKFLFPIGCF